MPPAAAALPKTPNHLRYHAVVARLIGRQKFLQRCKHAALAERISAEVTEKLIVVVQHVQEKAGAQEFRY